MNENNPETKTWFVVFKDADGQYWWKKHCRKGFTHVFLIGEYANGKAFMVDPVQRGCNMLSWELPAEAIAQIYASYPDHSVLRVDVTPDERRLFSLETHCVGMVKRFMGIERPMITLFPESLYTLLQKKYDAIKVEPPVFQNNEGGRYGRT